MKNRRFDTFIRNIPSIDKKICISKFPPEILFDLIDYVRNHWEGGYKGVLFVNKEIKLHRIVFTNSINAQNCVFEKQVEFYNCVFEKQVEFYNCIFEEQTKFDKSSFLSDVSFKKSIFRGGVFKYISFREVTFGGDEIDFCLTEFYSGDFSKAIFKENSSFVDFKGAKLYNVTFNEAQFERIVSFEKFENPTEIKNTKFERAIFSQQANFHNVLFYDDISFQNAIFRGKTYFLNITSKKISENTIIGREKEFSFNGAKFQNEMYFNGNNYIELNFSEVEFGVKDKDVTISFSNAKFYENIRFHHCDFYSSINFENTTFEKLVDFHGAIFCKAQPFHFTDFSEEAIFANVKFKKEVQFLYCKIKPDSYIRFESSIFERGLEISRSNFKRNINFWDITIAKEGEQEIFRNLNNQHYEDIKYIDDFGRYSTKKVSMVYRQIRETYRIIKDNFYAQNNRIEGLKFYEKEMSVYLQEKRAQDSLSKVENNTTNEIVEKSSKKENNITNKHIKIKFLRNLVFFAELFSFIIINSLFSIICVLLSPLLLILCIIVNILDLKIFDNIYINIKNFINFTFCELHKIKEWNSIIFHFFFISLLVCLLILYIIYQEYVLYWIMLFVFLLYFFSYFYKIKTKIKENIRNNDYMSLVLLLIPIICFFILLYGENNYQENDFVYRKIEYFFFFFKLSQGKNLFILELILMFIAITLAFLPRKQDRILLWFNKNSNSFGTDWVVGINFTMLVALVATIIVLLLSPNMCFLPKWEGIGNFMRALVEMFNITEWKDIEILGERPSNWQYIFIFLARIFIAYGMYQTIQAFRKFGKS